MNLSLFDVDDDLADQPADPLPAVAAASLPVPSAALAMGTAAPAPVLPGMGADAGSGRGADDTPSDEPPGLDLALHPAVWRASQIGGGTQPASPSGFAALDAELPGGGWPHGVLTELLLPQPGIGELRLLAPVLRAVSTPAAPHAPAAPAAVPAASSRQRRTGTAAAASPVRAFGTPGASVAAAPSGAAGRSPRAATTTTTSATAAVARTTDTGRCVMLFDPPASLSAWALAQCGLDSRHWLVVRSRPLGQGQQGRQAGAAVPAPPAWQPDTAPGVPRGASRLAPLLPGADLLWALEQALKSGQVGAVLAWLPVNLRADALRRLQLAAQAQAGPVFLFRDALARGRPSPAPLRLLLQPAGADALALRILKRRGPLLAQPLKLALPPVLPPALQARLQAEAQAQRLRQALAGGPAHQA